MFLQWFSNLKWIRAIREYNSLIERVGAIEKECNELERALEAKAATHSAMGRVLQHINDSVNLAGPIRRPATLRPRPGESAIDLLERYKKTDLARQLEGRERHIAELHRAFKNLAEGNWHELSVVSEYIQADVDKIVERLRIHG